MLSEYNQSRHHALHAMSLGRDDVKWKAVGPSWGPPQSTIGADSPSATGAVDAGVDVDLRIAREPLALG